MKANRVVVYCSFEKFEEIQFYIEHRIRIFRDVYPIPELSGDQIVLYSEKYKRYVTRLLFSPRFKWKPRPLGRPLSEVEKLLNERCSILEDERSFLREAKFKKDTMIPLPRFLKKED